MAANGLFMSLDIHSGIQNRISAAIFLNLSFSNEGLFRFCKQHCMSHLMTEVQDFMLTTLSVCDGFCALLLQRFDGSKLIRMYPHTPFTCVCLCNKSVCCLCASLRRSPVSGVQAFGAQRGEMKRFGALGRRVLRPQD